MGIKEDLIKADLERLQKEKNAINNPMFDLENHQSFKVNINIDNSVAPALFKPDPNNESTWLANELTFKALKKDIFTASEEVLDVEVPYQCSSCKSHLDMQFWLFCPHCGESFKY